MPQRSNHCHFHCAWGFDTPILAHMLDSLVRVSRRGKENHFVNLSQAHCKQQRSTLTARFQQAEPRLAHTKTQHPICKQSEKYDSVSTDFLRFPFSNFRYSLTLFSKFFASFPHGTCALSVSHRYLALDGIYHPL